MKKILLFLLFISAPIWLFGQAITTRILVMPPYPNNVQDLLTRQFENVFELKNNTNTQQQVYLGMRIYSENGISVGTAPGSKSSVPIIIPPQGMRRVTGNEIENLINGSSLLYQGISKEEVIRKRAIPEGYYFICISVFDFATNIQVGDEVCSSPISIMSLEPPSLRISNQMKEDTVINTTPQNLIFNWNTPSNIRFQDRTGLTYKLKLVEVPAQTDPNQAVLAAPQFTPEYTIKQSNFFTYGPSRAPLKVGQRYAAILQIESDNYTFRNSGKSEVISFVFGGTNGVVPDDEPKEDDKKEDDVPVVKATCSGHLDWAFSRDNRPTKIQDLTSSKRPSAGSSSKRVLPIVGSGTPDETTYPLQSAAIVVYSVESKKPISLFSPYSRTNSRKRVIGTGRTDENGNFQLEMFIKDAVELGRSFSIQIRPRGNSFQVIEKPVTIRKTATGFDIGTHLVQAKTGHIAPKVYKPDFLKDDEVQVDLLVKKSTYDQLPYFAQVSNYNGKTVEYNGTLYVPFYRYTNSEYLPQIVLNSLDHYVLRASSNEQESFKAVKGYNLPEKHVGLQRVVIDFVNQVYVSGLITHRGQPRINAMVKVELNRKTILSDLPHTVKKANRAKYSGRSVIYTTFTDAKGYYSMELPLMKVGSEIKVNITDNSIREKSWSDSLDTRKGITEYELNFDLIDPSVVVVGRIKSETGAYVSNALISSSSNSAQAYTGQSGLFVFQLSEADAQGLNFDITADEMSSSTFNPLSGDAGTLSNGKKTISSADWVKGLEKTRTLKDFLNEGSTRSLSPLDFGSATGSMSEFYGTLNSSNDVLTKVYDMGTVTLSDLRGQLTVKITAGTGMTMPVKGLITHSTGDVDTITSDNPYVYKASKGNHTFTITPLQKDNPFVAFYGEYKLSPSIDKEFGIILTRAIKVSGKVFIYNDSLQTMTDTLIPQAEISVEGLKVSTTSNDQGEYSVLIPANEDVTFVIRKDGFNTTKLSKNFEAASTFDLYTSRRDPNAPEIHRMLGYNVALDKLEASGSADVYIISGELYFGNNPLFSVNGADSVLHFVDVAVVMDGFDTENCIPRDKVQFDEVSLEALAYGFMPTTILGAPTVQLRQLKSSKPFVKNKGVIGGKAFKIATKRVSAGGLVALNMKNVYFKVINGDDKYLADKIKSSIKTTGKTESEVNDMQTGIKLMMAGSDFEYAFAPGTTVMPYLTRSTQFEINFASPDFSHSVSIGGKKKDSTSKKKLPFNKEDYVKSGTPVLSVYVNKTGAVLDSMGMHMEGYVQIPKKIPGVKVPQKGLLRMDKLIIGKTFEVKRAEISVADSNALELKLQKWTVRANKVILLGLGSPNLGVGFGGHLHFKTDTSGNLNKNEALTIKELSIQNASAGITLVGDFILPDKGISFSKLNFTTPPDVGSGSIKLTFNATELSFEFKGSGRLRYGDSTNSGPKVVRDVFPINIQTFMFRSRDLSFFLHATANAELDLKVAKLTIRQFMVNIGYAMSMNKMAAMMARAKTDKDKFFSSSSFKGISADSVAKVQQVIDNIRAAGKTPPARYVTFVNQQIAKGVVTRSELNKLVKLGAGSEDKPMHGSAVSWAVGIQGDIGFGIKGINTDIGGTFLVAENSGGIQVRLEEILLKVESPAFKLSVQAKMAFSEKKQGFEGSGELELLKRGFAASFKFYHYAANASKNTPAGIELGAALAVSVSIPTGPVTWHSIGGGFDLNTVTQKYKVFVMGELGPTGTPKESVYLNQVKLSVLFDVKNCGPVPIVEGSAGIAVMEEDWGLIKAKLDFCRMFLLVTFDNDVSILQGLSTVRIQGVAFGLAPQPNGREGSLFIGVNATVAIKDIARGNAIIALGVNFNKEQKNVPSEVLAIWPKVNNSVKEGARNHQLNAFYLNAGLDVPKKSGEFTVALGTFKALAFKYSFSAGGDVDMFVKFTNFEFFVDASVYADATANVAILKVIKLNGSAEFDASLTGGYNETDLWHFSGDAQLKFQLYDKASVACNSIATSWITPSWKCTYWCGPVFYPWDKKCKKTCYGVPYPVFNYKLCVNLKTGFKFKQDQAPKVSFSMN